MARYFGTYADFDTVSKKDSGTLIGADNQVGDVYDVNIELKDGVHIAWLDNRFGQRIGFLGPELSRRLKLLEADGLVNKAILSFVAFSNEPDEGHYWGQVAIISFPPAYSEEYARYVRNVGDRIADDIRPKIDLDAEGVDKILESGGEWIPEQTVSIPENSKTMAVLKRRRKFSERMIEKGRQGNKGCYIVSWAFLLLVAAAVIVAIKLAMGW